MQSWYAVVAPARASRGPFLAGLTVALLAHRAHETAQRAAMYRATEDERRARCADRAYARIERLAGGFPQAASRETSHAALLEAN